MSKEKVFDVKINLRNIGPYVGEGQFLFDKLKTNKVLIYANNGCGKTSLSRAFRLIEEKQLNILDDNDIDGINSLVSEGEESGTFAFSIDGQECNKSCQFVLKCGEKAEFNLPKDILFHVFNSDYIEENIAKRNYVPDGDIDGYVVGKELIEIDKIKEQIQHIESLVEKEKTDIKKFIEGSKQNFIAESGAGHNLADLRDFDFDHIVNDDGPVCIDSSEEFRKQFDVLREIPDLLQDIPVSLSIGRDDNSVLLENIRTVLCESFKKEELENSIVEFCRTNRSFVECGISIMHDNKCPFCGREYSEEDDNATFNLIRQYRIFLEGKEFKLRKKIATYINSINILIEDYSGCSSRIKEQAQCLNEIQRYFPSLRDIKISEGSSKLYDFLLEWKGRLERKEKDLGEIINCDDWEKYDFATEIKRINALCDKINKVVESVNKKKQLVKNERTWIRKNWCKATISECRRSLDKEIVALHENELKRDELKNVYQIKLDESNSSKRGKVAEAMETLLDGFFHGKYSFDKKNFEVIFQGKTIGNKICRVLSDGEKAVVAFCYYIASTHVLVTKEEDYKKLFFVIDDPVSSMDYNYVYSISNVIKHIIKFFPLIKYEKVWILTHNVEFSSILAENKVCDKIFTIVDGKLSSMNRKFLDIYMNHLLDVYNFSKQIDPCRIHTVLNSTRHILETIMRFEYGNEINMDDYVYGHRLEELGHNQDLVRCCHDLSHGRLRMEVSITNEQVQNMCLCVVDFLRKNYPGQIQSIECKKDKKEEM